MTLASKSLERTHSGKPAGSGWNLLHLAFALTLSLPGFTPGDETEPAAREKLIPAQSLESSPPKTSAGTGTAASPKVARYARFLIEKYDLNRDGRLQQTEWKELHGQPELIDRDANNEITPSELTQWIADYGQRKRIGVAMLPDNPSKVQDELPPVSSALATTGDSSATAEGATTQERRRDLKFFVPGKRLPQGLPDWFVSKDLDGDGQLTAGEFSPTSLAGELAEFANLDANRDGILTAQECVRDFTGKNRKTKPPSPSAP